MKQLTPYQKDALNYSANILLSANAGSGKTFVLSKRFVEILVNEGIDIDNIVAITFTDKAAGELNKKIADEIELRIVNETDEKILRKLEQIRSQLVSANISTIHSFCINILKEFAPEAGIDANFIPIDQATADELLSLSIEESLSQLLVNAQYEDSVKYLFRFFASKNTLVQKLSYAISHRKTVAQNIIDLYSMSETDFIKQLQKTFEQYFNHLFTSKINSSIDCVESINKFVLSRKSENEIALEVLPFIKKIKSAKKIEEKVNLLNRLSELILTQKGEVKNRGYLAWERDNFVKEINVVESFFDEIGPILKSNFSKDVLKEYYQFGNHFIKIFKYILEVYIYRKNEKGYIDFEDILLLTQQIITYNDVKEFLRSRYKYIMIDEYQDTNEIQYQIFMPILDGLKEGNLFVVGDEKQSIYMFRDAELEIFARTKEEISKLNSNGKLLPLPHSFRMSPQLVLFTNQLFKELFKNPDPVLNEVNYSELVCAKNENEKGSVEFLLVDEDKEITEAEMVASRIVSLINDRIVEPGDVAILCRKRSMFAPIEQALVKKNVRYNVVGGKGFYQKQSVNDIYNYLTFLLNNDDDAALIGILRSPFYNLSDAVLFEISLEEGDNFFNKLKRYAGKFHHIQKIVDSINDHQKLLLSSEVFKLIRKILSDRSYWAVLSSKNNSEQEIANIKKLIAISREYYKKSFKNLYDFTTYLREAIESVEDEGQAQISKETNTVKLLTIHQAKGLEFKAVFLFGTNESVRDDSIKSRSMGIDKEFGFPVKVFANGNYFYSPVASHIVALYNYIRNQKNIAEIKRLLYVAVTRAMNYLFISATHKNYDAAIDSFLNFFQNGLKSDLRNDSIILSDDVEFMQQDGEKFIFNKKPVKTDVKVLQELDNSISIKPTKEESVTDKKYLLDKITDVPSQEFISATKISMFSQCPVKYELSYELGYPTILNVLKQFTKNLYDFNNKEDEELSSYASVKGKIIHEVLKENFTIQDIDNVVNKYLAAENIVDDNGLNQLKANIKNDLSRFYNSNIYKKLSSFSNYKNEFEIYAEEGDNYLYGIIDKFIIEEDRLIVVDYKTDDIEISAIKKRADDYFQQLTFYAYVLSKYYSVYNKFVLQIVFIKHPESIVTREITLKDLENYRAILQNNIHKIQNRIFKPNLSHCSSCHFTLEGDKCIKPL